MSKYVKIATFSFNPIRLVDKPKNLDVVDYEIEWLEKNIDQVLVDKPDLIVMPEICDKPMDLPESDAFSYFEKRGDKVLNFLQKKAKVNSCYIAHSSIRKDIDGSNRNSVMMINRNGEVIGAYNKNYLCPGNEMEAYKCLCGKDATVFNCDFGRVGAVICFDLNFEEMRYKYKNLKPDLMLFSSNFGGGLMKNFFAFDTRSYFVSSCAYDCPAEIINPLGVTLKKTTNHYNYLIETLNLDYAIVHLDRNWEKIKKAKEKYGQLLKVEDVGYIGVVMLVYEGNDTTAKDILKEFKILDADEYLNWSREQREKYLE